MVTDSADPGAVHERAAALHNRSVALLADGRVEEALQASDEAVRLYRQLAESSDADLRWHLGTALITYSTLFAADEGPPGVILDWIDGIAVIRGGYTRKSLAAAREGTSLLAELYAESPDRYRLDLVRALRSYALRLAQHGDRDEALPVAKEACRLTSIGDLSAQVLFERSKTSLVLAELLGASSQPEQAADAGAVAVAGFSVLLDDAPEEIAGWYAEAVHRCAAALEAQGDHARAATWALGALTVWLGQDNALPPTPGWNVDKIVELYVRARAVGSPSPREAAIEVIAALDAEDPTPQFESLLASGEAEELWRLANARGVAAARRGDDSTRAKCLSWMAVAAVLGKRHELALDPAEEAIKLARQSGDGFREGFASVYLGNALRALNRMEEAAQVLAAALQAFPEGRYGRIHAVALISLAQVSEQLNLTEQALELYRSAAVVAGGMEFPDIAASAEEGVERLRR
jgi:tetratricopeptide (TPR) repeat protein